MLVQEIPSIIDPNENIVSKPIEANNIQIILGDKLFILRETVNGVRISVPEEEYREIEIRPQSKQEIYLSLR